MRARVTIARMPPPRRTSRTRIEGPPPPPAPRTPPRRAPRVELAAAPAPLAPPAEFVEAASALGVEFEGDDLPRLGLFLALLLDANQRVNLTAIREPEKAWTRHILDALTLLPLLADLPEGSSVIDVGSGGGLPGVPLAITMPGLRFTLLEATGKKAEFLSALVPALGLGNCRVINERAERLAHDRGEKSGPEGERQGGHREAYDAAIIRAVGRLAVAAELTVPFVKPGGRVLLVKGEKAEEELAEAAEALHQLKATHEGTIQTPTGRVVVLGKSSATPRMFPRPDGEPARVPLGVTREGKK